MTFWNNPKLVNKSPLVTAVLFEFANSGQLWRMWTEHTAAGQSLWGWLAVTFGLLLYVNFYRVCTPGERWAFWATAFSVFTNSLVVSTVVYFRYFAR